MGRIAWVKYNDKICGTLEELPGGFRFIYNEDYFDDENMPPISLTIPKTKKIHESLLLFPFFYGLLAEGVNKEVQCRTLKIDESDYFTRLIKTAGTDTIGAITVQEIK